MSKRAIWRVYHAAAEANSSIHPIAYTTFCFLWRKLTPSVIIMKPRSDLCWQCNKTAQLLYVQPTILRPTSQLHTPMHWSTFKLLGWRGSTTSPSAMSAKRVFVLTIPPLAHSHHRHHAHTHPTTQRTSRCTILRLRTAGALSIRSAAAWPHLLPYTSELHSVWSGMWGFTSSG